MGFLEPAAVVREVPFAADFTFEVAVRAAGLVALAFDVAAVRVEADLAVVDVDVARVAGFDDLLELVVVFLAAGLEADFFVVVALLVEDFAADRVAAFAAGFLVADFFAAAGFFADVGFFAAVGFGAEEVGFFAAADFFVVGFVAAGFFIAGLAPVGFFAAGFFAAGFLAVGFAALGEPVAAAWGGATEGRTTGVPSFVTVFGAVVASGEPSEVLPLTGNCFALASGRLVMCSSSSVSFGRMTSDPPATLMSLACCP